MCLLLIRELLVLSGGELESDAETEDAGGPYEMGAHYLLGSTIRSIPEAAK